MEYSEFTRHVGKAGLTLAGFARLIGVSPNSVTNYSSKPRVPISYAIIAILLGDAADRGLDPFAVLARYGVHGSPAKIRRLDDYRRTRPPIAS